MCDYCNFEHFGCPKEKWTSIIDFGALGEEEVALILDENGMEISLGELWFKRISVQYCPFCGSKLKQGEFSSFTSR